MALQRISPVETQVAWDRRQARPARIRWQGRDLCVTGITTQRDELAAYPADRGPRVTYLLETDAGQAWVVFDGRRRRWYIEALDLAA
jgi:hypothetical protein